MADEALDSLLNLMNDDDEQTGDDGPVEEELRREGRQSYGRGEQSAYFSAAEDNSWLDDSTDLSGDADKTISPNKLQFPTPTGGPKSVDQIQRELNELKEREAQLQSLLNNKKENESAGLRLVPLDFIGQSKPSQSVKSVVHSGDTSSSEDELDRNAGDHSLHKLNAEGRVLKRKIQHKKGPAPVVPKPQELRKRAVAIGKQMENSTSQNSDVRLYDSFFGFRIRTPKVSSQTFSTYCSDRERVRINSLRGSQRPTGNWVTMAVLVDKTPSRKSSKGNQYAIWRISDLDDCQGKQIKLFLFGEGLKEHWKIPVGNTIAFFDLTFMEDQEGQQQSDPGIRLKVSAKQHVLELGPCPDFGFCRGKRKQDGKSCQNVVNRTKADFCTFHLVSGSRALASRRGELQSSGNRPPKGWEQRAFGAEAPNQPLYQGKGISAYRKPPPLSLEQVRANRKDTKMVGHTKTDLTTKATIKSTAALAKEDGKNSQNPLLDLLKVENAGTRNLLRQLSASETDTTATKKDEKVSKSLAKSGRQFLSEQSLSHSLVRRPLPPPKLGRGFPLDGVIPLGPAVQALSIRERREKLKNDAAKQRAAAVVSGRSEKRERVAEIKPANSLLSKTPKSQVTSPFKKRTRLGEIDLNKEKIEALLKSKSSHEDELEEEDAKKQDQYFNLMEAREKVEQNLVETTEIKDCNVFSCKRCGYTWHCQSAFCKQQGHLITRHKADKRFFKCKICSKRTIAYTKLPSKACKECGGKSFERTGMKEERKGPDLPGEELKTRGDEQPFVNA